MNKKQRKKLKYIKASSLGLEMGLSVIIGSMIGYWLDEQWHTKPWMTIIWFFIGCAASIKAVLRYIKKQKNNE